MSLEADAEVDKTNDKKELAFYENVFRGMLCSDSSEYIENDSVEHAAILVKCLIENARKSVKIFCKALSSDVWGRREIVQSVEDALANKVAFKVSVMEVLQLNGTSRLLMGDPLSEIRMFPYRDIHSNFLLVDDKSFRFEPDCEMRRGFAVVRAEDEAKTLYDTFERIWKLSEFVAWDFANAK